MLESKLNAPTLRLRLGWQIWIGPLSLMALALWCIDMIGLPTENPILRFTDMVLRQPFISENERFNERFTDMVGSGNNFHRYGSAATIFTDMVRSGNKLSRNCTLASIKIFFIGHFVAGNYSMALTTLSFVIKSLLFIHNVDNIWIFEYFQALKFKVALTFW